MGKNEKSEHRDEDKSVNDKMKGSEDKSTWESGSAEKADKKPIRYKKSKKYWRYRATGRQKTPPDAAWVQDDRQLRNRSKSRIKQRSKKKN
ncbi:hypothetical protein OESDEN_24088 [Oesophagostomum dentatum]|uniref:Uncharacterized protein n=1 Tax=Oesophagostomum dentatum TaxID=61180 RepID=A0A0B1RYJ4_OESDE|nr:hypothetical protein OESDEN_24088 [Oesophagostomum dentatum]